jgi:hypothetical protein
MSGTEGRLLTGLMLLVVTVFLVLSLGLSPVGRYLPLPVAVLTLALLLAEMGSRLLSFVESGTDDYRTEGRGRSWRELTVLGWLLGFTLAILTVGFLAAVPAFVTLYLHYMAKRSWTASFLAGFTLGTVLFVLFDHWLEVSLYKGYLWAWVDS